jgi:hypothetical protein
MKVSLFYLPRIGSKGQVEEGMVGLPGEIHDQMVHEVSEQAQLADVPGYDAISLTGTPFSCGRLRGLKQSGAARSVHRDADHASARRAAW